MHGLPKESGGSHPSAGIKDKTQKTFGPETVRLRLFILLVISDQILKLLAAKFLQPAFNSGIVFGVGKNVPVILILTVSLVLVLSVYKSKSGFGEVLLLAGGAGNILDRLIYGKVVDWIKLWSLWFNLADVYIVGGIAVIIVDALIRSYVNKAVNQ